jgi:hypothetical protein
MKLPTILSALALSASLTYAEEISMTLEAAVPPILPATVSPPTAPATSIPLWLPPKHTDVILPLGTSWPLPPLLPIKAVPYSASPETFTARVIGQTLYVKPDSIAAHP